MTKKRKIDFSDIPELTAEDFKRARFANRPGPRPKNPSELDKPISIRVPPALIAWAKKHGKFQNIGYQTFMKNVLLQRMRRFQ